jgi:hypothetical protein
MPRKVDRRTQAKLDQAWLAYYRNQARKLLYAGAVKNARYILDTSTGTARLIKGSYPCGTASTVTVE